MLITASIHHEAQQNEIQVSTQNNTKTIAIAAKPDGRGLAVNGGELLLLALATCYCNDVYREAGKRNIAVKSVAVTVSGSFEKEGQPGTDIRYSAKVDADCSESDLQDLLLYVDKVAEVHNTLRAGTAVKMIHP